jgi:carboxypeptidase D
VPVVPYVEAFDNIFRLNDTYMAKIKSKANACGYYDYLANYLRFPPPGPIPQPSGDDSCAGLWADIKIAASVVNPCFNMYQITTTCPLLWDVLGFPGSFEYRPKGSKIYFDRPEVKRAINAPVNTRWAECKNIPLSFLDVSEPSSFKALPRVIEKSERTIVSHGTLDFILMTNGTLLSIQNMTWNGAQGFQKKPVNDFFVPYHKDAGLSSISGSGLQGIAHTERGLTWVEVFLSGHMVPQYTPSVAFRQMEFLLGRIPTLNERTPFTTQQSISQPQFEPSTNDSTRMLHYF